MPTTFYANGQNDTLTTDASGLGGAAPGDSLYIGAGSVEYAAGTNLTAVDLLKVALTAGWGGDFPAAAPLQVTCNRTGAGELDIAFRGQTCYFSSSGPAGVIATVRWHPTAGGRGYVSNATITKFIASSGFLQVAATCNVTTWEISGNCQVQLLPSGTTNPTIGITDFAAVEIATQIGALTANGNARVSILKDTVTPSSITWNSSGTLDYRGGDTTINMNSGVFDFSKISRPLAITRVVKGKVVIVLMRGGPPITWTSTDDVEPEIRYV